MVLAAVKDGDQGFLESEMCAKLWAYIGLDVEILETWNRNGWLSSAPEK